MEKIIKALVLKSKLPVDHPDHGTTMGNPSSCWYRVSYWSHASIKLTGRWRIVRHTPYSYSLKVEYTYAPCVYEPRLTHTDGGGSYYKNVNVGAIWKELGDDLEYRQIKRVWVDSEDVEILEEYIEEEGEIQECCNGSN